MEVELPRVDRSSVSLYEQRDTLHIIAKRILHDSDFSTAGDSDKTPAEERSNANIERESDAASGDGEGLQSVDGVTL